MTKSERNELSEIKHLLEDAFKDRYDPENGWKTARAVFETKTIAALEAIHVELTTHKKSADKVPDLVTSVNDIQCWRKKVSKVMIWIGMVIGTPILGGVGYIIFRSLFK